MKFNLNISVILFASCLFVASATAEFKVGKVIEIAPPGGGVAGPLKWSPCGEFVAFTSLYDLYTADTMGNYLLIATLPYPPHRFEWLSDSEIVLDTWKSGPGPIDSSWLLHIYVPTGTITTLEQYSRGPGYHPEGDPSSFSGPYLTLKGKVYYEKNVIGRREQAGPIEIVHLRAGGEKAAIDSTDHLQPRWGEDGLYLISADNNDSSYFGPKPYQYILLPPAISSDRKWYIHGGTMCQISSGQYLVIDTVIEDFPVGMEAVDIMYSSFSDYRPEVLFNIVYFNGLDEEISRLGIFNYQENILQELDTVLGIMGCSVPAYSPLDGWLSLVANGKGYLVLRED